MYIAELRRIRHVYSTHGQSAAATPLLPCRLKDQLYQPFVHASILALSEHELADILTTHHHHLTSPSARRKRTRWPLAAILPDPLPLALDHPPAFFASARASNAPLGSDGSLPRGVVKAANHEILGLRRGKKKKRESGAAFGTHLFASN